MNKHVASLSKGLLSVFLILSLVLPSISLPLPVLALEGAAGGEADGSQYGGGASEGESEGESDSDGDGTSDAAEADASQAAADAVASAASVAGVEVGVAAVDTANDPNAVAGKVSVDGVTMSVEAAMAAIGGIADAQSKGLSPSTSSSVPGIDVGATLSANAMGELGSVVGSMTAEVGSPQSVAAAETQAAIGHQAGLQSLGVAAGINGMNPAAAATTNALDALSTAARSALFSPISLMDDVPVGFTFSRPDTVNISPTPMNGLTAPTATFSTENDTVDATAFSFADDFSLDDTDDANFVDDPATLDQYAQYALGMEIGRMATQKSLAESRYSQLSAQTTQPFAPTNQAQMAALASTKAEIDAWSATIDSRVNPTTQNQAVATLSQSKAADLGKMAADMATAVAANDTSKANQLSQAISAATAAYDAQIADAKSSLAAAQKSLDDANIAAQSAVNAALGNPVSVTPSTDVSLSVDESLADQAWGKVFGVAPTQLSPVVAPITTVLSVVPVVGIAQKAALSVTPTPVVNTIVDVTPFTKSIQAYMDDEPISTVLGLAAIDALGLAFGKAVSVGLSVAGATAGKASVSAPSSTAGKAAAAPAAASTAGKTTAGTTGKTVSVSYNPTNNTVTVHAPVTTSAVVEGKMASAAAKAADDVATPAATVAKSADDVAVAPAAVAKSADDAVAPTSPTSGKAPTAANDNVPSNTPANANSLGSKSATTPTAAPAAKSVDNVTSPTPQTANTPANPNALGSKSATTPTSSASPASKSLSTAMALAQALSAPVAPAAISKSLAGIVDDVAKAISRTADDISLTNPTTLSPKSIDDVAVPATSVGTAAKSAASTNATAPVAAPVSVTPTTVQTTPVTQVAAQPTTPAQTTVPATTQTTAPTQTNTKAPVDNVSVPFSPLSPLSQAQVQSIAKSITDTTQPTVLGTIAVDMPESLGRTSTLGAPQTATLSTNPVTGLVDVTLDNHPLAQVNSITPAQAQTALAASKATPMPNDVLTRSIAAIVDFVAPPAQVIGTFTLSIPDKATTPTSISVTSVAPNQAVPAQQPTQAQTNATAPTANQTAPTAAQTSPTAPATFAQTPDVTNAVPTSRPNVTTTAAQPTNSQTTPAPTANQTAPATAPTAQAPASTLGPVGDALSTIGKGLTDVFNELFGVKPAASQPAKTVNFANLEKTPATQDFVGAVADDARFLSFEDNTTAARALLRDLENKIKSLEAAKTPATLKNITPIYSPASDNNNPTQHANNIASVAAKDVPGFTADTPITLADLKGPVGVGLVKGFAKAEEGIDLPTAEAVKGVAAYTALPSIPTTLVDGVYAPTNPADQVTLNNIRNGSPTNVTPAVQPPAQTVLTFADKLSKSTPVSLALEVQAAGLSRIANTLSQTKAPAAEPAVATPSAPTAANPSAQTQASAQVSPTPAPSRVVMQNQDARRDLDITPKLKDQIAYAAEKAGVVFVGTSGGQPSKADVARGLAALTDRTGSNRHDHGNAVDGYLKDADTGRVLDFTNPKDLPRFELFIAEAVKAGVTGVGAGVAYMGPNKIHVGGGSALAWGAGGKVANAPGWLTAAHKKGLADAKGFDLAAYKASQAQTPQATPAITTAIPTPRPDTTPVPVTIPVTVITQTNPVQATTPQPGTGATVSAPTSQTTDPVADAANADSISNPGYPSSSGQNDDSVSPTSNSGTPPDYQSTGGTDPDSKGTGVLGAASSAFYAMIGLIATALNNALGTDLNVPDKNSKEVAGTTGAGVQIAVPTPAAPTETNDDPSRTSTETTPNSTVTSPTAPTLTTPLSTQTEHGFASTTPTVNVLIQVDGGSGDMYFSIAGVYDQRGQLLADTESYAEQEPDNEATGDSPYDQPRITLDDQRLNILYSDGTYAPVVVDGVWYESPNDPNYVYTVEYYFNGELVAAADNAGVLPQGNPLTNLLGNLFKSSKEYDIGDVDIVTRALIDPNEQGPADEYYVYRVHLKGGGLRSTTVPRYTSYRYMSERFAETGFIGSVMALIAESVEIPPPSKGGVSAVVDTFRKIGLSIVDLFKGSTNDDNPIVTDFGTLTPSDDGEITMSDVRTVTVILDVEAECPFVLGLSRPYLYEIVIAQAAISGATTDQAFRAVRCGGGDKADFVEQIATHFESFDGVGTINRQAMSNIIRFALFKDLDLSALFGEESTETTGTTTAPTVPDNEDAAFTPNLTNEVNFEVKAVGSGGQVVLDWTPATEISIGTGIQLYFRWSGTAYEQCLPFLNDSGDYALKARGSAMTTGNTESESYDVREASTTYRIECGGQRNNEFGVDQRSVKVIIE